MRGEINEHYFYGTLSIYECSLLLKLCMKSHKPEEKERGGDVHPFLDVDLQLLPAVLHPSVLTPTTCYIHYSI